MPFYQVHLERTQDQTVTIEAGTEAEAIEAAWEVAESSGWQDVHDDQDVHTVGQPARRYWSGGPEGDWVTPS